MPTPPDVLNYKIGGAHIILGGLDLGNIVSLEVEASADVLQHFTARSGARKVDAQRAREKRLMFRAELDEHSVETYRKYFMAGGTALQVDALTNPLEETNVVIEYREEAAVIWTYSHTRASARPSAAMSMGEFNEFVTFGLEIEPLIDEGATPPMGRFTFTA